MKVSSRIDADEVHQHLPHRQGEDEEGGVLAEERVGVAEVSAVQEQEHLLPAPAVDDADDDGDDDGDDQHQPARPAAALGQLEDVAVLRSRHGEQPRGDLAGQPEAPVEDREEDDGEEETHAHPGHDGSPEDVGVAHLLIPEVVGPEAGDEARTTRRTTTRMMTTRTTRRSGPGLRRRIRWSLSGLAASWPLPTMPLSAIRLPVVLFQAR